MPRGDKGTQVLWTPRQTGGTCESNGSPTRPQAFPCVSGKAEFPVYLMMGQRGLSQRWGEGHTFGHINVEIFVSLPCTEVTNIKLRVLANFFLSFLLPLLEILGFMRCSSPEIQRCAWTLELAVAQLNSHLKFLQLKQRKRTVGTQSCPGFHVEKGS